MEMIALMAFSRMGSQDLVEVVWFVPKKLGFSYPTGRRGAFMVQAKEPYASDLDLPRLLCRCSWEAARAECGSELPSSSVRASGEEVFRRVDSGCWLIYCESCWILEWHKSFSNQKKYWLIFSFCMNGPNLTPESQLDVTVISWLCE